MLLATAGGEWAAEAHGFGRTAALILLGTFGLALALPKLAERALRPLQYFAGDLESRTGGSAAADWVLGISTGLLWAPCAGPVLGLILTTAALHGGGIATAVPLLSYATGAATMLLLVRLLVGRAGRRLPATLRAAIPFAGATGRIAGVAVLAGVLLIVTGWDSRLAVALPGFGLDRLEQTWLDHSRSTDASPQSPQMPADDAQAVPIRVVANERPALSLPVLGQMPRLEGATTWLQSPPLKSEELRGKVVLVDFWTFGCINCQRAIPHVRAWSKRYRDAGLVVIGVHAPEFAFEKSKPNVEKALKRLDLDFPNAMDNDFKIWNAWSNQYWPTVYLIDAQGRIRWTHIGEGAYDQTEQAIQQLLDEAKLMPPAKT